MTGWDGGFFGLPFTCECRIYGETEGRKNCSEFKKRVTKSDLLNKIQSLEKENEKLKSKVKRLQDIATRTEAEKEEYADLYCKCENELIKNSRRCDNFMTYKRFIVPKEKDDERFYITDTGLGLDTVSDEMYSFGDEEDFCRLFDKLNEQQSTIDKLEQRDYYNQSERYKILCRAIELTATYIDNSNEEHYDFCALVTEFEKELLDDE